jgi:hypothetical protein
VIRFLAGLGAGLVAAAITSFFTYSEPWWLLVGACTAVVVWFGQYGIEAIADAVDDLF